MLAKWEQKEVLSGIGSWYTGHSHESLQSLTSWKQRGDVHLLQITTSWRRAVETGMAPADTQAVTD